MKLLGPKFISSYIFSCFLNILLGVLTALTFGQLKQIVK